MHAFRALVTLQALRAWFAGVGNFAPPGPFNFTGFPGYRVELLAGSIVLAMDNNSLTPDEGRRSARTGSHARPLILPIRSAVRFGALKNFLSAH